MARRSGSTGSVEGMEMARSSGNVEMMMVRDTKDFKEHVDLEGIVEAERVPKRIVVVGQFPEAGTQIPAGTPVHLTVMYKDSIDIGKLKGMSEEFAVKYKDDKIGKVVEDISANPKAKEIIEKEKEYKDLTTAEKNAMKKYARDQGILTEEASSEKVEKVYKDLKFIYTF